MSSRRCPEAYFSQRGLAALKDLSDSFVIPLPAPGTGHQDDSVRVDALPVRQGRSGLPPGADGAPHSDELQVILYVFVAVGPPVLHQAAAGLWRRPSLVRIGRSEPSRHGRRKPHCLVWWGYSGPLPGPTRRASPALPAPVPGGAAPGCHHFQCLQHPRAVSALGIILVSVGEAPVMSHGSDRVERRMAMAMATARAAPHSPAAAMAIPEGWNIPLPSWE